MPTVGAAVMWQATPSTAGVVSHASRALRPLSNASSANALRSGVESANPGRRPSGHQVEALFTNVVHRFIHIVDYWAIRDRWYVHPTFSCGFPPLQVVWLTGPRQ